MKINVKSNFVVPGLEDREYVEVDRTEMTLRQLLEELQRLAAPSSIEYVRPGARALDPDDWEVDINGLPYQKCEHELETPLKEGDTVSIRIMALGGG
ncbi:MAG: hypothetical protein ABSC55_21175 [Syntrophorhabdales bacterium]